MNLEEYLAISGNKYLVIGKSVWEQDGLAQQIAPEPRHFTLNGTEYTVLSIEPSSIPNFISYMESHEGQYEFGWVQGNGRASYITHAEALALLASIGEEVE